jgi:hypothetical protein
MSPDGDRRQGTHYSGRRWTRMRFMHLCVERFEHQANVEVKWAELTKADSWRRDDYIKESGFATPPGSTSPDCGCVCGGAQQNNRDADTGRQVAPVVCPSYPRPTREMTVGNAHLRACGGRLLAAIVRCLR